MPSDFGALGWLPFVLLGLLMTVGYGVWRYLKDKEEKERRAQGFTHKGRRKTKLEEELQAEIDRVRAEKRAGSSAVDGGEDGSGLAPPAEERKRLSEIKELVDENPDRPRDDR